MDFKDLHMQPLYQVHLNEYHISHGIDDDPIFHYLEQNQSLNGFKK